MHRLDGSPIDWALTGSTGMALQGVPLVAHDIDVQTNTSGAYEIARILADVALTPVRYLPSESIRSHYGVYELAHVRVEIMGDMEKLVDGIWEPAVDVREHRRWVETGGVTVPVMDLRHEVNAYQKMGRFERAELLSAWLEQQGS